MRKVENDILAQLLVQLKFTPENLRYKQLDTTEKLLGLIDSDKSYPFEFVCFHITGHRPKGEISNQLITGSQLIKDLPSFIARLSAILELPVNKQKQKVYSIAELADNCGVSVKTIHRWRQRGLVARRFIFDDGSKRLGFLQSSIDTFLRTNPELTRKAKSFIRLTNRQKQEIANQASSLARETGLSRYRIIEKIASDIGKSHEVIRYTLLDYENANPGKTIFKKPPGVISAGQAQEIFRLFEQGCSVKELMKQFHRSKSSIYRIINRRKAKNILKKKLEFIASDEFSREDAREKILAEPIKALSDHRLTKPLKLSGDSLTRYIQALKAAVPLNRSQETELFRRYNYLKYLAVINRTGMKPTTVSGKRLRQIEGYLGQAELIKRIIIEANLRLVVSIARKHSTGGGNLSELISEGNFSLMRAVEKFDYTREVRFATYASWAIAKNYAHEIPAEAYRPDKAPTASLANVQRDLRIAEAADVTAVERARKSLIQVITDNLDKREQYIILNHFGLLGTLVKKNKKTLKQIGDELDLSKERVRQIELIALQKLRYSLSGEQFELLTG